MNAAGRRNTFSMDAATRIMVRASSMTAPWFRSALAQRMAKERLSDPSARGDALLPRPTRSHETTGKFF